MIFHNGFTSTFVRELKMAKLCSQLRPSLTEVTHPMNRVIPAMFKFKDIARYGVYAMETGKIREKTLNFIIENDIIPFIPSEKNVYHVPTVNPLYRKSKGTKNGGGHAAVNSYYAKVFAGRVIFEFNAINDALAIKLYHRMRTKLPLKTYFRIRPTTKAPEVISRESFEEIMSGKRIAKPCCWIKRNRYLSNT